MPNSTKISIIIPCYNHGSLLKEALSSIEQVRNENICEVIIVNDGSTDVETCQSLQKIDGTKYTVINQPNRGLGAARNAGITVARGEFILPLDSDNRIRRPYLTEGVRLLAENPNVGVVYGNAEYFGEKMGLWEVPEFDLARLAEGNYIDACALYRKSVWESVQGYDEKMPWMGYEDWDFWRRTALRGWRFHHLNEIAFDYRVSGNSMLVRETNPHLQELHEYISSKRESGAFEAILRKENEVRQHKDAEQKLTWELARMKGIERSVEYRFGKFFIGPLRKIKRMFTS